MTMLTTIKAKWQAFRNWRDAEDFQRGYDCTAGALLRGEVSPPSIIETANLFRLDATMKGALTASRDFQRMLAEEPPR